MYRFTCKRFIIILITLFIFSSCKKIVDPALAPLASFRAESGFGSSISVVDLPLTIGAFDTVILKNSSLNTKSVTWSLGGKIFSTDNITGLKFDSAGKYVVSMIAMNKDGKKNSTSMNIVVKERILKSISIDNLDINSFSPSQNGLPVFSKIDLWVVLKNSKSSTDRMTSNGDVVDAQIIYQSPVFQNIDSAFHSSLSYSIPPSIKTALEIPILYPNGVQPKGLGLMLNLYGKDHSGTYLLASSRWSGVGLWLTDLGGGNPTFSDTFGLKTYAAGSPTSITMNFLYQ